MALVNYSFTALINTDSDGDNTIAAQAVTVKIELDASFATIYSDKAGASPITQPGAVTDSNGVLDFWVLPGIYLIQSGGRTETVIIDNGARLKPLTVSEMVNSKHLRVDDVIKTAENTDGNGGGATYDVVLTSGVTPNTFNIIKGVADPLISFVLRTNGAVDLATFGAKKNDQAGFALAIQAWSDYCSDNELGGTGEGTYFVEKTVYMNMVKFDSPGLLLIEPTTNFFVDTPLNFDDMSRRVIVLNRAAIVVKNMQARNGNNVADLIGMDYAKMQITTYNCGGISFKVNKLWRNFSITDIKGRGINGGTNIAYAKDHIEEINTLTIIAGDYYGNTINTIDIGDKNGLFSTSIVGDDNMGSGIAIIGKPALDGPALHIDSVINIVVDAYHERGGVSTDAAITLGGKAEGSLRNITISGYANGFNYFVQCLSGVNGLTMTKAHSRLITKSALYLTTDQFPYKYEDNTSINSFTEGQEVHTGVRALSTYLFNGNKVIDVYGLLNGVSVDSGFSNHIYKNKVIEETLRTKLNYIRTATFTAIARLFTVGNGSTKTGSVSGTVITFATQADVQVFNGGDGLSIAGINAFVLKVDYIAKTMTVSAESSLPSGDQTIIQPEVTPTITGIASSTPTRNDGANGSMLMSSVGGQAGWVYRGSWIAFS